MTLPGFNASASIYKTDASYSFSPALTMGSCRPGNPVQLSLARVPSVGRVALPNYRCYKICANGLKLECPLRCQGGFCYCDCTVVSCPSPGGGVFIG